MANKVDIEVELKISKAMSSIRKLNSQLRNSVNSFNKNNAIVSKISNGLNSSNNSLNKMVGNSNRLHNSLKGASNSTNKMKSDLKTSDIYAKSMAESATQISKALAGIVLGTQFIQAAETYGSAVNKLNNINSQMLGSAGVTTVNGVPQYSQATQDMTEEQLDKIFNSAQSARTNYGQMIGNVGKQALLAGDAFGNNMDNVIKFNELMAKSYTISGATTEEQLASMTQLTQALGAGVLQGDELKSVREGATMAYNAIEAFAQKVYDTDESLKELGAEGLVTSDLVVAAILENADAIDQAMELSGITVGQFWTLFKNSAFYAFSDTFSEFNKFLAKLSDSIIYEIVIEYIYGIAKALTYVFKLANSSLDLVEKYEDVIKPMLQGIILLLTAKLGIALVNLQREIVKTILSFLGLKTVVTPQLLQIIGIVGILYASIYNFTNGSIDSIVAMTSAIIGAASAFLILNGVISFSKHAFRSLGMVALGVLGLVLVKSLLTKNSIIEGVADLVANIVAAIVYLKGQLEYFVSVVVTTFMNVAGIIANTFGNIVTMAMNTISNLVTALNSLKNLENPFKADYKSITDGVESMDSVIKRNESVFLKTPTYNEDALNAYNSVYDKIVNIGNSLKDKYNEALTPDTTPLDVQSPDISDMLGDISDTADNTDKISSDLNLITQDLSFLKDLAELEWKKEFTTANINVSMTNNNNISDKNDIGDIATILKTQLQTELKTVASGTYT